MLRIFVPMTPDCFHSFKSSIAGITIPEKFTFPFYYEAHELSKIASAELQDYLNNQTDFSHNFGIDATDESHAIGKMFGVLVVQNKQGELGYLAAFSGKLANSNDHPFFVPPLFDMLQEDGFYRRGEEINTSVNNRVEAIESNPDYQLAIAQFKNDSEESKQQILDAKQLVKKNKSQRSLKREEMKALLSPEEYATLLKELSDESIADSYYLNDLIRYWKFRVFNASLKLDFFQQELDALKKERKERSNQLQQQLFESYAFLNARQEEKSLLEIFENYEPKTPPSGAGECAAPKLLNYAYANDLKPIAMAEFWWGKAPNSEIRKHGQFYPSCKSKCEPILGHMLQGLEVDENPMKANPALGKVLKTIYEDEWIVVVNKPADFLSVPGKTIEDSVLTRLQEQYPNATGPLLVHRIDMSTSGILLAAKTKEVHQLLQEQFINRKVSKRYVALLDGELSESKGEIDLPLRVDLDNRPQQLVCYDYGKPAKTRWKTLERKEGRTKVYFYPITGRTHQLRVHAAHQMGLNTPIVGDDLYGSKSDRLYLHAEFLKFVHPISRKTMIVKAKCEF